MNANEKVLLLAEMFGVDVSKHIDPVIKGIEQNEHFKKLSINVEMARKYQVPYTQQFLKEYDDLKINKINSFKDALIARAKIDYLYQISEPKYYINPIMFNPVEMKTNITTIGELPCFYKGKETTINSFIKDKDIDKKEKNRITNEILNKWHLDAKETILDEINAKISKRKRFSLDGIVRFFKRGLLFPILYFLGLAIFAGTIFSSRNYFDKVVNGSSVTSVVFLIFTICYFLFMAFGLIDYNLNKKYLSEKDYCLYYLKSHAYLAIKGLDEATYLIKNAFVEAIKNNSEVETPIDKVNTLANFRRIILYLNTEEETDKRYNDKLLEAMNMAKIIFTVLFIISLLSYIVLIVLSLLQGGAII